MGCKKMTEIKCYELVSESKWYQGLDAMLRIHFDNLEDEEDDLEDKCTDQEQEDQTFSVLHYSQVGFKQGRSGFFANLFGNSFPSETTANLIVEGTEQHISEVDSYLRELGEEANFKFFVVDVLSNPSSVTIGVRTNWYDKYNDVGCKLREYISSNGAVDTSSTNSFAKSGTDSEPSPVSQDYLHEGLVVTYLETKHWSGSEFLHYLDASVSGSLKQVLQLYDGLSKSKNELKLDYVKLRGT